MTVRRILRAAALPLLFTACTASIHRSNASNSAEGRSIREARAAQNRAIVAGDVNLVASFWTEDVTLRRGLGTPQSGRAAYRRLFEEDAKNDSAIVYQRDPVDVEVSARWPLAFETGTWRGYLRSMPAQPVIRGRYSAQWVKRDGHWLIRSEVFVALTCSASGCNSAALP